MWVGYLSLWVLECGEHGDRHDERIRQERPPEQMAQEGLHSETRKEDARVLSHSNLRFELASELDEVVALL